MASFDEQGPVHGRPLALTPLFAGSFTAVRAAPCCMLRSAALAARCLSACLSVWPVATSGPDSDQPGTRCRTPCTPRPPRSLSNGLSAHTGPVERRADRGRLRRGVHGRPARRAAAEGPGARQRLCQPDRPQVRTGREGVPVRQERERVRQRWLASLPFPLPPSLSRSVVCSLPLQRLCFSACRPAAPTEENKHDVSVYLLSICCLPAARCTAPPRTA
eukprot:SAG22_NODE_1161_length_5307_cov_55.889593_6_plen_218_part_00